jgi:hypothetical protein
VVIITKGELFMARMIVLLGVVGMAISNPLASLVVGGLLYSATGGNKK